VDEASCDGLDQSFCGTSSVRSFISWVVAEVRSRTHFTLITMGAFCHFYDTVRSSFVIWPFPYRCLKCASRRFHVCYRPGRQLSVGPTPTGVM
jgi:hypothetical protein